MHCTHCGRTDAERVGLRFDRADAIRLLTLQLCRRCVDDFLEEPGIALVVADRYGTDTTAVDGGHRRPTAHEPPERDAGRWGQAGDVT